MGADQHHDWQALAASALDWWRDAGVDTLVEEAPLDRLAPMPARVPAAHPANAPAGDARAWPATLPSFESWRHGDGAPESAWSNQRFAACGSAASGLAIVIDCPEREDGAAGSLLSGPAGKLFDRMLAAIGRDRTSIYLIPLCAARPTAGQLPGDHVAKLSALARRHLSLAAPKRVLVLGNAASRALLGMDVAAARGGLRPLNHDAGQTEAVASYPPRLLLERPERKADAWKDLQMLIGGWTA